MKCCLGIALFCCVLEAQTLDEGKKVYATNCAACHGDNADGSDQGPSLAGSRTLRSRSTKQLAAFIYQGRPSGGMPSFHLPDKELNAVAAFVHSLNSPASENPVSGDVAAGREFFFGKAGCGACHMAQGRGKALGPDLSNVGAELSVAEIRQALLHPDQRSTPGYTLVTVQLRSGESIRGFQRGRTNWDLQLQTLDGRFRFFRADEITAVKAEAPLMKPVVAGAAEMQNLLAFLSGLTGVRPEMTAYPASPNAGAVDWARIRNPQPGDWLTYNGTLNGNRYSDLKQIDRTNAGRLVVKWMFPIDHFGLEVTPMVADGLMYITGPNQAIALDASTGRQIWKYARPRTGGLIGDASLGTNRGLAILGDQVFMVTDNAHLIAINRLTGSLVWDVTMPEEPMHYGGTVAPLIVNDTVIAGVAGGDRGIRGFLACYKASTGERLWRIYTIPFKGSPGAETWGEQEPKLGGGATWLTGAYDPALDTLYWPTGNPYPDSDDRDRPGDNLFSNCILALDPKTGSIKWYFQFTPHDVHDWDATEPPLLVDTKYNGADRKLLLHADRNGFFYVLDRTDGKLLLAKQFIGKQTWTSGIGPDGRPLPIETKSGLDCPTDAANWNSAAYSPVTRFMFVLTHEGCRTRRVPGAWKTNERLNPHQKFVRAIDIDTGRIAWEIPLIGEVIPKTWPGILATAGGLVFYGDPNGAFAAADERDGKTLWHFATNVYMKASPMTFTVEGKQYVATVAGPNILCFGLP
ncbi:MAG: PQQ-binding-like beta-propeller repeat protein [Acidobacteriaceae bacterium]|nr:PQQ-binding-like beta-propeller repeat protein [Acidobacteriaceae bacterium]